MTRTQPPKLIYLVADDRYFCTHRLPLAVAAKQQNFDVHVISPKSDSSEKILHAGLTFHPLSFNRKTLNPFDGIKTILRIYRLYKQLKPDYVHHVAIKPVLFGTIAAHLAGVPNISVGITVVTVLGTATDTLNE